MPDGAARLRISVPSSELARLLTRCVGAYSDNTIRGYAADLRSFIAWCVKHRRKWLPASCDTIAAYIDAETEQRSISTIKRRIAAIKFAHRLCDHPDPTQASSVALSLRRAERRRNRRPAQASGLTADLLKRIMAACPKTLAGMRDAALISVGYDTLCRSSELAMMRVEHLRRTRGNDWSLLVPRSKGDQAGDGRIAWLSPTTVRALKRWLVAAKIETGPLFRSLHRGRPSPILSHTSSIRRLVKRAAERARIDPAITRALSGHSMRVGAAQDMLVAGFDAVAIMQAGGWRTPHVLLRYVENAKTQALHQRRWQQLDALQSS